MNYVYTSCALNFLPAAKALFRSVSEHLPTARKVLALVDRVPKDFDIRAEGADELFTLEALRDDLPRLEAWIFRHNVMELSTAVKPFILERLLQRSDCETVLFLDCDCVVFSRLETVFRAFEKSSILLTPHACLPHTRKEWFFFELNPLKVGVFNLGFLGIRNDDTGRALATWWKERLKFYCFIDHDIGLFTDQKWMNLVPCYFDGIQVLRQPTLNVARWNTFQRHLTRDTGGPIQVDGKSVDFIHFSGFYKIGGYVKGLYDARTGPYCQNLQLLDELSQWYAGQLEADAKRDVCRAPWAFAAYTNGDAITDEHRAYFRRNETLALRYPNPFDCSTIDNFLVHYQQAIRKTEGVDVSGDLGGRVRAAEARAVHLEETLKTIYRSRAWKIVTLLRRARDRVLHR